MEYRKDRNAYRKRVRALVEKSLKELPKDFVMPYKLKKPEKRPPTPSMDFMYDDDVYEYDPDADSDEEEVEEAEGEEEEEEENE